MSHAVRRLMALNKHRNKPRNIEWAWLYYLYGRGLRNLVGVFSRHIFTSSFTTQYVTYLNSELYK